MRLRPLLLISSLITLALAGCSSFSINSTSGTPTRGTPVGGAQTTCPGDIAGPDCYTPYALRVAYGVEPLIQQGFTGKGITIVDIVSYGSPSLQQDMQTFDRQFDLPAVNLQILSPLGSTPTDNPSADELGGWSGETEGDVEVMHAIAPDAKIVVLTSPVDETEGTTGIPQFLQLEQYAVDHHLGQVVSQSWGASEYSLQNDSQGSTVIHQFDSFYQQATTQNHITFLTASGDLGASDYADAATAQAGGPPVAQRTSGFPSDDPWVTTVGGTHLQRSGNGYAESVWNGFADALGGGGASGGGVSAFFGEPSYQKTLPQSVQTQLNNQRGEPDVAAIADPATSLAYYMDGHWQMGGGTSFSTPLWAAIIAIADQKAGHPLGFINPALYKLGASSTYASDFRDITNGDNTVDSQGVHVDGFAATTGFDLCTGWGAPLADHLIPDLIAAQQATT
jgi:subtilase family serine protease